MWNASLVFLYSGLVISSFIPSLTTTRATRPPEDGYGPSCMDGGTHTTLCGKHLIDFTVVAGVRGAHSPCPFPSPILHPPPTSPRQIRNPLISRVTLPHTLPRCARLCRDVCYSSLTLSPSLPHTQPCNFLFVAAPPYYSTGNPLSPAPPPLSPPRTTCAVRSASSSALSCCRPPTPNPLHLVSPPSSLAPRGKEEEREHPPYLTQTPCSFLLRVV